MMIMQPRRIEQDDYSGRWRFLLVTILVSMSVLIGRAVYLQVLDRQFLIHQGDIRHVGVLPITAHRGRIIDRNGELLAVSTPVKSIWANPKEFIKAENSPGKVKALAGLLGVRAKDIAARIGSNEERSFVYLKRRISPELADRILGLGVVGIYAEREFRRYYPTGEVTAHILGFTNIDDQGQEGMELAFNNTLKGVDGAKRIVRDGKRRIIEAMEDISLPVPGKDLALSIDERLQYLAYREVKRAVMHHRARAASLVLLDTQTGEILAMVNQPSYNPNSRASMKKGASRNRALTDVFEPGSTMKPFAVACALELELVHPGAVFRTGLLHVGSNIVRDVHNYGTLDVAHILQKSSNVGVTQIALRVPPKKFWAFYNNLGFGQAPDIGFPGETTGRLPHYSGWNSFEQATLSFGYGVSASALQLGRAYLAFANDGVIPMVTLLKRTGSPEAHEIMSSRIAVQVRTMLEAVVSREGTAIRAAVPGYRIAGKTGTVKKISGRGYSGSKYLAVFAGMAPASQPRLAMVVMVDEPSAGEYYGGVVAAPIFSAVMEGALRTLNIAPDEPLAPLMAAKSDDPA